MLKDNVVQELKRKIRQHRDGRSDDPLTREALQIRDQLDNAMRSAGPNRRCDVEENFAYAIDERVDEILGRPIATDPHEGSPIYDAEAEKRARGYRELAMGRATPLRSLIDRFYAEQQWSGRTTADFERTLNYLEAWCASEGLAQTIETFTKRLAGDFSGSLITRQGVAARTANKYISGLSTYWKWLMKRGHVDANVWSGQSHAKPRVKASEKPRAFTDTEVVTLFRGAPRQSFMLPAMAIAALTGARLGAVIDLRVKDCDGGEFRFAAKKHELDDRVVPIHSDLLKLVERRVEGKQPSEDLFPDIPRLGADADARRERGQPLTKAFGRYRRGLGVDDVLVGKKRSRVTFHSFRNWFINKASIANAGGATGFSPWTIADVVGHSNDDMPLDITMGVYRDASTIEAKRLCVEAVKLPEAARNILK